MDLFFLGGESLFHFIVFISNWLNKYLLKVAPPPSDENVSVFLLLKHPEM